MLDIQKIDKPYIIAEIGSNHNGDLELAKVLITAAKDCGADAVKFQFFNKENLFTSELLSEMDAGDAKFENVESQRVSEQIDEYTIDSSELLILRQYCKEVEIDFGCTAVDENGLNYLAEIDPEFIKLASHEVDNPDLIETAIRTKKPIIMSVGMADLAEIDEVYRLFKKHRYEDFALLHCVSLYPPRDKIVDLNFIKTMQYLYDCEIGYSDHTLGYSIALGAIALGARIIEKHFTIDKNMPGWDHQISADREDMKIICEQGQRIFEALGNKYKFVTEEEIEKRKIFRKSLTAKRQIKEGEVIKYEDLTFKRPGNGISPRFLNLIIGRRAGRIIKADATIRSEDLI